MSRLRMILGLDLLILAVILGIGIFALTDEPSEWIPPNYTYDEVMNAYEAGHYQRVLTGRGYTSPDGAFIVTENELYRVRDGRIFEDFDYTRIFNVFSADGRYVVQMGDGIYRLPEVERIIALPYDEIHIDYMVNGELEHRETAFIGRTVFSNNGEYVAVTGDGIYRLSDGEKVIETSGQEVTDAGSLYVNFSPDSSIVATASGVYRLSDGAQILVSDSGSFLAHFSPDSAYIVLDAIYRASDGERLLELIRPRVVSFTPDMAYAVVIGDGVYRLSDLRRMYGLGQSSYYVNYVYYSSDGEYMYIPTDGIYRIQDGLELFDLPESESQSQFVLPIHQDAMFSPDSEYVVIENDGVYRLSNRQQLFTISGDMYAGSSEITANGAYLIISDRVYRMADGEQVFDRGGLSVSFSPNGEYVALYNDGVYRLSDGQRLFEIDGSINGFTDDSAYFEVGYVPEEFGIYRLSDGRHFPNLRVLHVSAGILADEDGILIVDVD